MTRTVLGLILGGAAFVVAATANSGGYRYGVSDQAFYTPAVLKDLHPSLYPRDTALLAAESRLMWSDEIVAGLSRALHVDLPPLYLALYVLTLVALFLGGVAFARGLGLSWWATAAFVILLTFRHRIARTGANSLEGYMHPRMLAFALGVAALATLVRRQYTRAWLWAIVAACWHPTTAFWFSLAIGAGFILTRADWRRWTIVAVAASTLVGIWALTIGPLAGRLVIMDPAWLAALADKDYLFPHEWPADAWAVNVAYPIAIVLIYRRRRSRGLAAPGEHALVVGMAALFGAFVLAFPFTVVRLALAVQMQVTRVFWLLDLAAAAYVTWWIVDDRLGGLAAARRLAVAGLAAAAIARGGYMLSHNRQLFSMRLPQSGWIEALTWLKRQPPDWYVLADHRHTFRHGVSVRLAAEKDTLVEAAKDTALAMYDRSVAMRVSERLWALRDFDILTTAEFRALAERYGLDVLVIESGRRIDLPVLYRNDGFVIYRFQ